MRTKYNIRKLVSSLIGFLIIVLFYISYNDVTFKYNNEQNEIRFELDDISSDIMNTLDKSIIHLNLIGDVFNYQSSYDISDSSILGNVRHLENSNQFVADVNLGANGSSLSGIGDFTTFDDEKKLEILHAALLTPYFELTKSQVENIQWIYYVSSHEFINLYPRAQISDYVFTTDSLDNAFYQLALPQNNFDKKIVATPIYNDEAGKGLMITLSKPIYTNTEFQGVLSLDFTLGQLNQIVNAQSNSERSYLLVNDYGEIIASNGVTDASQIVRIEDHFSKNGFDPSVINVLDDDAFHNIQGYLMKKSDSLPFNWKLIVISDLSRINAAAARDQILPGTFILLLVGFIFLYSRKVHADLEAYNNRLQFEQVVDQAVQLMAILDLDGRILYINQTARSMVGKTSEELVGKDFYNTPWWNWSEELMEFIKDAVIQTKEGNHVKRDVIHYDTNGEKQNIEFSMNPILNNKNEVEYLIANGKNITDRIKLKESMNRELKIDVLTNLGNRRAVIERIEQEISIFRRKGTEFSLLLLDVDHFKNVNDTYGHNVGDEVLKALGEALKNHVRPYDEVGRWGGEEFIVILPDTSYEEAVKMGERICALTENMVLPSLTIPEFNHITVTIGVTIYDKPYDLKEIVKQADDALYCGKAKGRNQVVGYKNLGELKT